MITPSGLQKDWVGKQNESLSTIKEILERIKPDTRFDYFCGFPWIFEESEILANLISGRSITYDETPFKDKKICSAIEGWSYVETKDDTDKLFDTVYGFNDSCLKS